MYKSHHAGDDSYIHLQLFLTMNLNDTTSSQSVPPAEIPTKKYSAGFQKAQRYVGLVAVVWLAYVLLSPGYASREDSPRPFVLNTSYYHKTLLTDIAIFLNGSDAWEVGMAGRHIVDCEIAKRSESPGGRDFSAAELIEDMKRPLVDEGATVTQWIRDAKRLASPDGRDLSPEALARYMERLPPYEKKKAEQRILDACGLYYLSARSSLNRVKEVEPKYLDLTHRFNQLSKEARAIQGLTEENQPSPTAEMVLITRKIENIRDQLVQEAANRLVVTNGVAHVLLVILVGVGIWLRGRVGWVLLAPFAWLLSSAKKVHEKI